MSIWHELPNLKPCPFCGGKAELTLRRATWSVHCTECRVIGKSVEVGDPINSLPIDMILDGADKASKLWNRRSNDENP